MRYVQDVYTHHSADNKNMLRNLGRGSKKNADENGPFMNQYIKQ